MRGLRLRSVYLICNDKWERNNKLKLRAHRASFSEQKNYEKQSSNQQVKLTNISRREAEEICSRIE